MSRAVVSLFVAAVLAVTPDLLAQKTTKPIEEMTLQELLEMDVTIATKGGISTREAPGIITLVTSEEIVSSGARDLIDVLRLVPGLDFGVDVQGVVGIGVRGAWAHEGKLLLLIDGIEMNEPLYSTLQFGNRFPVDSIDRIEIIRGPGSAIYGGYAELGVVNVITRSADRINGLSASVTDGEMSGGMARRRLTISNGWVGKAGTSFVIHGSAATGNRSDQNYIDINGDTYDFDGNSRLSEAYLNMALSAGNFSTRLLVDRYHTTERDQFGENLPRSTRQDFDSWTLDSSWAKLLTSALSITPRVTVQHQVPWNEQDDFFPYHKIVDRYRGNVTLNYAPGIRFEGLGGVEFFQDRAKLGSGSSPSDNFPNGRSSISYSTIAAFSQGTWDTRAGKFTAGARYEHQSESGSSFVPRFALTKVLGRFHVKALASRAFRAPGIENLRLGVGKSRPEKTTALELEAGYQFTANQYLTANLFRSWIKGPIIYFVNPDTQQEGYVNADRTGTEGLELEYRYRIQRLWATVGYSYYRAYDNRVASYAVPGNSDDLLAFPAHKLTLNSSIALTPSLHFSPSLVFYGSRYGYDYTNGAVGLRRFGNETLLNLYLLENDAGMKGLSIGLGVYDVLGENHHFIQPYTNYHPPLPDTSREYAVHLGYHWNRR